MLALAPVKLARVAIFCLSCGEVAFQEKKVYPVEEFKGETVKRS